ncbi:hypothetical protein [Diaphorobacter aerolatus]|uniref:Uncharacterized protein n=1 Tax=Diaphorobacter aerolatus TaxID=1288495 RepID=A0A7H0GKD6_9BURK|nr:hypothetical protein [Diaphorobacter aerolatus]QNP48752.1 hypothetical protein H9K75_00405 [Diaphorobacter aerolatus]
MGRPGIEWTEAMLALLGTDKDAVLAARWGTTPKTVNLKRNALGIPAYGHVLWTDGMLARLGTQVDAELAQAWGISKASVIAKRQALSIPATAAGRSATAQRFGWTPEAVALLGTESDAKIAERLGLSRLTVYNARVARGIAAAGRGRP